MVVHPSSESLRAFGLGTLDDRSSDTVERHITACDDCRRKVAELSGDSLLNRVRNAHKTRSDALRDEPARPKSAITIDLLPAQLKRHAQYELVRELGRGGMGVVYLVRNKPMDRLEVLKVVNQSFVNRPGAADRFTREIKTAARLNHDHVVHAYNVVQLEGFLGFTMEYVDGKDLATVVKEQGPLPVVNACFYVRQAALGLQHAFEKGAVHRDIKPHNLILSRAGKKHVVKILDFGLAKATSEKKLATDLTDEGVILGTPDYLAPEQILDAASADIRADIYALGCTLYYLLAGAPPFSAPTLFKLLQAHQSTVAKRLDKVRSDVPAKLAGIVERMLAKPPARRFQTPIEVAQALEPFLRSRSEPVVGNPTNSKPSRRWLLYATLVGIVVAGALAMVFASGMLRVRNNDRDNDPKRTGGESPPIVSPPVDPGETAKQALEKFRGAWTVVADNGSQDDIPDSVNILVDKEFGNVLTMRFQIGKEIHTERLFLQSVDPTKSPGTIDFRHEEQEKVLCLGIYEFDGRQLKLCISAPGRNRPNDFQFKNGDTLRSFVLQK